MRLAVAQITVHEDPTDLGGLRQVMRDARDAGARLLHLPEGATCSPHKRLVAGQVVPSDWGAFRWDVLRHELTTVTQLARRLGLWTVLGSVHRLTPPHRPHNSLYVISDRGDVVTRYDERMLSQTKVGFMYAPGVAPVTFDVDGNRFGCALGLECHFPEVFGEYERLDVDCVLFSTAGPGTPVNNGPFALQARAHAAGNSFWVSYAGTVADAVNAPSGVISPDGEWVARCPQAATPALVIADLDSEGGDFARPWRRTARGGLYDPHLVHDDPRSEDRATF